MLPIRGERSLRHALREYSTHYLSERKHQGVGNQLLEPRNVVAFAPEPVQHHITNTELSFVALIPTQS